MIGSKGFKGFVATGLIAGVAAMGAMASAGSSMGEPPAEGASHSQGVTAGDKAPLFTLKDLDGNKHSLESYLADGKVVVLEWFNPGCPFVKKHHQHSDSMKKTYRFARENDVVWLAVNSGAPGLQGHGVELNKQAAKEFGIEYPILVDESGKVGQAYGAKTTPHMYVISAEGVVVYQGAIDSDRSIRSLGETNYVHAALKSHLAGETIETVNSAPYGCSVKYGG